MFSSLSVFVLAALLSPASCARVPGSPYVSPPAGLNSSKSLLVLATAGLSADDAFAAAALQGALARAAGGAPRMLRWDGSASSSLWLNTTSALWGVALDWRCASVACALAALAPGALSGYVTVSRADNSSNLGVLVAASRRGAAAALVPLPASLVPAARAAGLADAGDLRGATLSATLAAWGGPAAFAPRVAVLQLPDENACMSDFAIATGALQFWDDNILSPDLWPIWSQLASTGEPFAMLGWGPDEYNTVTTVSAAGGAVVASNWAQNLDVYSAFDAPAFSQPPPPPMPPAAAHTAAFLMSDGDNLQWLLDGFATDSKWWGSPDRGSVPLGWTLSPSVVDLAPVVAAHLYGSATPADHLVAGVSGLGYFYPDVTAPDRRAALVNLTGAFMAKAGMRLVNVLGHGEGYTAEQVAPYVGQPQIDAVFWYNYDNYAGLRGNITWQNGKPVIGARFALWGDGSNPAGPTFCNNSMLVDRLLALPRDPASPDSYSLIALHAWSHNVSDARAVASALAARAPGAVQIVTPAELVARVVRNLRPGA